MRALAIAAVAVALSISSSVPLCASPSNAEMDAAFAYTAAVSLFESWPVVSEVEFNEIIPKLEELGFSGGETTGIWSKLDDVGLVMVFASPKVGHFGVELSPRQRQVLGEASFVALLQRAERFETVEADAITLTVSHRSLAAPAREGRTKQTMTIAPSGWEWVSSGTWIEWRESPPN